VADRDLGNIDSSGTYSDDLRGQAHKTQGKPFVEVVDRTQLFQLIDAMKSRMNEDPWLLALAKDSSCRWGRCSATLRTVDNGMKEVCGLDLSSFDSVKDAEEI